MIYIPSDYGNTVGGISQAQYTSLLTLSATIKSFVNTNGGSLIALIENTFGATAYAWLPTSLNFTASQFSTVDSSTDDMSSISPATTSANLVHSYYHGYFWVGG